MEKVSMEVLMKHAREARKKAIAPYSSFSVGAALLASDGRVVTGCNIENAAYSVCCCAERVALFKALSEGIRSFSAIAVCGGRDEEVPCPPCGVCRQALAEYVDAENFLVYTMENSSISGMTLAEYLPKSFSKKELK